MVSDTHSRPRTFPVSAQVPLRGALEMVLEIVESQLEMDLGIGVGPVFAVGLLQGSQLRVHCWRTVLVTYNHVWA